VLACPACCDARGEEEEEEGGRRRRSAGVEGGGEGVTRKKKGRGRTFFYRCAGSGETEKALDIISLGVNIHRKYWM
jgi:hypothetical protein